MGRRGVGVEMTPWKLYTGYEAWPARIGQGKLREHFLTRISEAVRMLDTAVSGNISTGLYEYSYKNGIYIPVHKIVVRYVQQYSKDRTPRLLVITP